MAESTSADGASATPGGGFELDFGAVHVKARNITERVQLLLASTLSVAVLGVPAMGMWSMARDSRRSFGMGRPGRRGRASPRERRVSRPLQPSYAARSASRTAASASSSPSPSRWARSA
ncbi:hypothetical protein [Streptomyces misionensis]|uniref:hypothetical protein n=1 Tax=Streptomyces misionensis TaxID=67331 RepID=UPI003676D744